MWPKVTQFYSKVSKKVTTAVLLKKWHRLKSPKKPLKCLGYFWKKLCSHDLSKTAKSCHTGDFNWRRVLPKNADRLIQSKLWQILKRQISSKFKFTNLLRSLLHLNFALKDEHSYNISNIRIISATFVWYQQLYKHCLISLTYSQKPCITAAWLMLHSVKKF